MLHVRTAFGLEETADKTRGHSNTQDKKHKTTLANKSF
jgi:hypothetical protein